MQKINFTNKFKAWLGDINLPEDKKRFLDDNSAIFELVFEAGYKQHYEDGVFHDISVFHDIVWDTTNKDLDNDMLKSLFYYLPNDWQNKIAELGFYNVKDDLYLYLEHNGLPLDFTNT